MNAIMLKKKIKTYQKRKQLTNNKDNKKLEKPFLSKARKNYLVANIQSRNRTKSNL